jgi:cyclase
MFRPRVIPVLLLNNQTLVKSVRFKNYKYIGDPINAVRIFNDLKADELVFLDINASKENRLISLSFVKDVGEEANMPFAVGGGIKTVEHIRQIINAGAEKAIINSAAAENPSFIHEASEAFGSSTIAVCIDVKRNIFGNTHVWINGGTRNTKNNPLEFAKLMEQMGAGELIIQSIDNDGMMQGYDIELIKQISEVVTIPVVALGGAANVSDLKKAYTQGFANGLAAGSMFVYHGIMKGVLINYPDKEEMKFSEEF